VVLECHKLSHFENGYVKRSPLATPRLCSDRWTHLLWASSSDRLLGGMGAWRSGLRCCKWMSSDSHGGGSNLAFGALKRLLYWIAVSTLESPVWLRPTPADGFSRWRCVRPGSRSSKVPAESQMIPGCQRTTGTCFDSSEVIYWDCSCFSVTESLFFTAYLCAEYIGHRTVTLPPQLLWE